MNIHNSHDNIVLVAPRPVRLAAPYSQFSPSFLHRPQASKATTVRFVSAPADAFERLKVSSDSYSAEEDLVPPSAERDRPISPRASPLSTLPSEAVEEFLSILRPSSILFPPTSPIRRSTNGVAHGFVPYRRPVSSALSPAMSNEGLGLTLADQNDNANKDNELVAYPFKLFGSGHLSPVSRVHTRNPFPRHPSFDDPVSAFITQHSTSNTPSPVPMALSPAAIPLPLPTPDEADLVA